MYLNYPYWPSRRARVEKVPWVGCPCGPGVDGGRLVVFAIRESLNGKGQRVTVHDSDHSVMTDVERLESFGLSALVFRGRGGGYSHFCFDDDEVDGVVFVCEHTFSCTQCVEFEFSYHHVVFSMSLSFFNLIHSRISISESSRA